MNSGVWLDWFWSTLWLSLSRTLKQNTLVCRCLTETAITDQIHTSRWKVWPLASPPSKPGVAHVTPSSVLVWLCTSQSEGAPGGPEIVRLLKRGEIWFPIRYASFILLADNTTKGVIKGRSLLRTLAHSVFFFWQLILGNLRAGKELV